MPPSKNTLACLYLVRYRTLKKTSKYVSCEFVNLGSIVISASKLRNTPAARLSYVRYLSCRYRSVYWYFYPVTVGTNDPPVPFGGYSVQTVWFAHRRLAAKETDAEPQEAAVGAVAAEEERVS